MAYTRTRRETGVILLSDPFGRSSIAGVREILTDRRLRRFARARTMLFHRAKNGIHDPVTFFHLVEELASIKPEQEFTAADFAKHLDQARPQLRWDSVVVGRILNDLIESWNEANPGRLSQPLESARVWSGREYLTTAYPEARAILLNLIEDLAILGETAVTVGNTSRLSSPLPMCPSLGLVMIV